MQLSPSNAVVIELAAYRRPTVPDDEPPPSSQGARHPPTLEFSNLNAVDRCAKEKSFAYAR